MPRRVISGIWKRCVLGGCPGEKGRQREGPTASLDAEGQGGRLGRKVGANPAPQGRAAGTAGDAETRAGGRLAPQGLERAGHSPTAQWLPRVYILASAVARPAVTGAADPRDTRQRTSASRTSGTSRPRMVPTGSVRSAEARPDGKRVPPAEASRRPVARRSAAAAAASAPAAAAPGLYMQAREGGGVEVGGSSAAAQSALTSPCGESQGAGPAVSENHPSSRPGVKRRDVSGAPLSFPRRPSRLPTLDSFPPTTRSLQHNIVNPSFPSPSRAPPG